MFLSFILSDPPKSGKSIIEPTAITLPPKLLTMSIVASMVPPVAHKSSMIITLSFIFIVSFFISIVAAPYSKS